MRLKKFYLIGGGSIFSKKALRKLVEDIFVKGEKSVCNMNKDGFADDMIVGGCLKKSAIFVNELDEMNQKRFFPVGIAIHYKNQSSVNQNYWYIRDLWYNVTGTIMTSSKYFLA